eukprot:TRINITY_DN869_c1_g2_i1.p1 TRINITY_DN869_c1_g2~~TRINITY_DN869_c1_g2_i1.p1  ORF type:complete len:565 (+),score=71.89 TRINITY_DN869_c1_g2_i1:64-1695(+)
MSGYSKYEEGDVIYLEDDDVISHVVGSSCDKKASSGWKKFWMEHSGRKWPRKCQTHGCRATAEVGALVHVKCLHLRNRYFILPTCQACIKDPENNYYGKYTNWEHAKKGAVVVATKCAMGLRKKFHNDGHPSGAPDNDADNECNAANNDAGGKTVTERLTALEKPANMSQGVEGAEALQPHPELLYEWVKALRTIISRWGGKDKAPDVSACSRPPAGVCNSVWLDAVRHIMENEFEKEKKVDSTLDHDIRGHSLATRIRSLVSQKERKVKLGLFDGKGLVVYYTLKKLKEFGVDIDSGVEVHLVDILKNMNDYHEFGVPCAKTVRGDALFNVTNKTRKKVKKTVWEAYFAKEDLDIIYFNFSQLAPIIKKEHKEPFAKKGNTNNTEVLEQVACVLKKHQGRCVYLFSRPLTHKNSKQREKEVRVLQEKGVTLEPPLSNRKTLETRFIWNEDDQREGTDETMTRGKELMKQQKLDEAIEAFEEAKRLDPTCEAAATNIVECCAQMMVREKKEFDELYKQLLELEQLRNKTLAEALASPEDGEPW